MAVKGVLEKERSREKDRGGLLGVLRGPLSEVSHQGLEEACWDFNPGCVTMAK